MEYTANRVILRGSLAGLPAFSHENHARRFYRFFLEVERLSGTADVLPVIAAEDVLNTMDLSGGGCIEVRGQLRSFNSRAPSGRKLILSVYAAELETSDEGPENLVELTGALCKPPVYRRTPLGREICDVMLAVPRAFQPPVPPHGLSALHSLGTDGAGGGAASARCAARAHGAAAKPRIRQAPARRKRDARCL